MKTKLRKLLALLMTLAMFISSVPTTALAAVVPYPGGTDTGSGISLSSIVKPPVATTTASVPSNAVRVDPISLSWSWLSNVP